MLFLHCVYFVSWGFTLGQHNNFKTICSEPDMGNISHYCASKKKQTNQEVKQQIFVFGNTMGIVSTLNKEMVWFATFQPFVTSCLLHRLTHPDAVKGRRLWEVIFCSCLSLTAAKWLTLIRSGNWIGFPWCDLPKWAWSKSVPSLRISKTPT